MKNNYCGDFFDSLEESGIKITDEEKEKIYGQLDRVLNYVPKIGVFGKTGVGKSSLCNALFGTDVCPISDVKACTRDVQEVLLDMGNNKKIQLIDVPGVGESTYRDNEYSELYAELLPELDLVLWVLKADDRAMSTDEIFYKNIVKPHIEQGKPFFFVLNQIDKIEPCREWDNAKGEPSDKQYKNIEEKKKNIAIEFDVAQSKIIPIAATEKYNLVTLVDEFIRELPSEKKFTTYKAVNEEFKSESTGEHVKKSLLEVIENIVCKSLDVAETVICKAIETVGNVVIKCGDWLWNKICKIFK